MNNDRIEYTLPGVMHYLQQQFTRNERDRISWELERSEMRNRIVQLENEIRQLKREKLTAGENWRDTVDTKGQFDGLLGDEKVDMETMDKFSQSQQKVRENVREIIYLLNGPHINDNLQTIVDTSSHVHQLDYLNINDLSLNDARNNNDENNAADKIITSENNTDTHNVDDDEEDRISLMQDIVATTSNTESDTTVAASEIPNEDQPDDELHINNEIIKHLPKDKDPNTNPCIIDCTSNKIITLCEDKLVYYILQEHDNSLQEMNRNFSGLDTNNLKYISWINSHSIITLNDHGIKIFDANSGKLLNSFNPFNDTLQFENIISCTFKNKWLLIATNKQVTILEFNLDEPFEIITTYQVKVNNVKEALLGITEKSFLTISSNPLKLVIYNFTGVVLQTINLSKEISKKRLTNDIKLFLNKDTSKLLIQLMRHMIVYSFEQKRIVFQKTLSKEPLHISFKYDDDLIGFCYSDGVVEWRHLANFEIYHKYQRNHEGTDNFNIDTIKIGDTVRFISLDESGLMVANDS